MKNIKLIAPVKSLKDLEIIKETQCKGVYIYHSVVLNNFADFEEMLNEASEYEKDFYVNFRGYNTETELKSIETLLCKIQKIPVKGIMINSLDVLFLAEEKDLDCEIFIDSGLNIHNIAGVEFVSSFSKIKCVNLTEEIYIKNIERIKKFAHCEIAVNSDNLSWIVEKIIKNKILDAVLIKGDFADSAKLKEGIDCVNKILQLPKISKTEQLPFKNFENPNYTSNHFLKIFHNLSGKDFKFRGNIHPFSWKYKKEKLKKILKNPDSNFIKVNLRLNSLEQLKYLTKFIDRLKFNPVYSVEFGEIINTCDLSKNNFYQIINKVKKDCFDYGIQLQLSTPRILNERDFDRGYEFVKLLCAEKPIPSSIIVNNLGYFHALSNDSEFDDIPLEIGTGINLLNSFSINCLLKRRSLFCVDLSNIKDIEDIKECIDKVKSKIQRIKLQIAGSIRVPSLGLCPMNNDQAILSRLSCSAPCHKGNYSILDPGINKSFPFVVDGFCRMHLFKDKILDMSEHIKLFQSIGINEFVIDFSGLIPELVPVMLTRLLNYANQGEFSTDSNFVSELYNIKK